MALGSLIIKERLGTSDRETVEQITENRYLQYYIGLPEFQEEAPFHHSLMTHFRKRLNKKAINQVNEWIIQEAQEQDEDEENYDDEPPRDAPAQDDEIDQHSPEDSDTNQGK